MEKFDQPTKLFLPENDKKQDIRLKMDIALACRNPHMVEVSDNKGMAPMKKDKSQ